MALNSDLIMLVEQSPDTLITLITGEKFVVRETPEEILSRVITFRRAVLQGLAYPWDPSSSHPFISSLHTKDEQKPER